MNRTGKDPEWTVINVGSHKVLIQECFCGVAIETDQGLFGIAQRDGGIEILLDGNLVWSSVDALEWKDPGAEISEDLQEAP